MRFAVHLRRTVLGLGCLLAAGVAAGCQGGKDPNGLRAPQLDGKSDISDHVSRRGSLTFGAPVQGQFSEDLQYEAYTIAAKKGAVLSIVNSEASPGLDTVLFLYGPADAEGHFGSSYLALDDESGGDKKAAIRSVTIAQTGTYLAVLGTYLGVGRGSYTLALTCDGGACALCPAQTRGVAQWQTPQGRGIDAVVRDGDTAYILDGSGQLWALDVSDPTAPRPLNDPSGTGQYSIHGEMVYADHHLFIPELTHVTLVDVSTPDQLKKVSSFAFTSEVTPVSAVDVAGSYAYVTVTDKYYSLGSLQVFDISSPATPKAVAQLSLDRPTAVKVVGAVAYVAARNYFVSVDVSNPAKPVELGRQYASDAMYQIEVGGNTAYVLEGAAGDVFHDGADHLQTFDVSDPKSIQLGSQSYLGRRTERVQLADGWLFSAGFLGAGIEDASHLGAGLWGQGEGAVYATDLAYGDGALLVTNGGPLRIFSLACP